jgi:hypothetical protein
MLTAHADLPALPHRASLEEKLCTNKMYCPNKRCSAFINLDKLQGSGQGSSTGGTQAACPGEWDWWLEAYTGRSRPPGHRAE